MIIKSYAKINLFLEILGKNQQNYHILESLMCFLDIHDEIEIKKSDNLSLEFSGKYADFLKNDKSENIILKTIKFMAEKFNFEPNLKISLEKNIPISAGVGGGSSNCATIILALNEIFNLNLNQNELTEIGLKMGCDVPICLNNKMALVEGVGEKITQIDLKTKPLFALIVNPNKFLSTKKVFCNLNLSSQEHQTQNNTPDSRKQPKIASNSGGRAVEVSDKKTSKHAFCVSRQQKNQPLLNFIINRKNHLEQPAQKIMPEISLILQKIKEQQNCALSRMSGSGATCFGLFDRQNDLKLAYENLKTEFPEFYLEKSRLIYDKNEEE